MNEEFLEQRLLVDAVRPNRGQVVLDGDVFADGETGLAPMPLDDAVAPLSDAGGLAEEGIQLVGHTRGCRKGLATVDRQKDAVDDRVPADRNGAPATGEVHLACPNEALGAEPPREFVARVEELGAAAMTEREGTVPVGSAFAV